MHLLLLLQRPTWLIVWIGISFLLFDVAVFAMNAMPGSVEHMCVPGGALTWDNMLFYGVLSMVVGLLVMGFAEILRVQSRGAVETGITAGVGGALSALTVACTACTLPVLSLFGVSFSLYFITEYGVYFRIAAVLFVLYTAYRMNGFIKRGGTCALPKNS